MLRGGWIGFNRGFYKSPPGGDLELQCLNESTRESYEEAIKIWINSPDVDEELDIWSAFGDLVIVGANMNKCEFRRPSRHLRQFCREEFADQMSTDEPENEYDAEFDTD